MNTLGAVEQFLVKTRDIWSPDQSVCGGVHRQMDRQTLRVKIIVQMIFL